MDIASGKGMGYKYFGAAKQLPGVKELFELPPEIKKKRNRYEMYKRIDMDYYGFRDDEDGVLENLERDAEKEMRAKAIEEWERIEAVKAEARKGVKEVRFLTKNLMYDVNVIVIDCFIEWRSDTLDTVIVLPWFRGNDLLTR